MSYIFRESIFLLKEVSCFKESIILNENSIIFCYVTPYHRHAIVSETGPYLKIYSKQEYCDWNNLKIRTQPIQSLILF